MSNNLGALTLASALTLAGCSVSTNPNHGFGITVVDTTINGTQQKAMLIIDNTTTVRCSKNFETLSVVSKVNKSGSDRFQQIESSSVWKNGSSGVNIYRTADRKYTTVSDSSGESVMWLENVKGNGTWKFKSEQEFNGALKKCNELQITSKK